MRTVAALGKIEKEIEKLTPQEKLRLVEKLVHQSFLLVIAVIAVMLAIPFLAFAQNQPGNQMGERLNVIMLDICSTRADHFGAYGYSRDTTPNMDQFATQSVLFENALSEGSWCLPSYASLLTGHVPEAHGLYTSIPMGSLPPFETTLAQARSRGAAIGPRSSRAGST